ncbi:SPOR domain-containing protein [Larkinella terrae]|uniref:SPOR domain-containing protein n=1 Tax=Larkinella terrae TaxID=2025311 RepID=A0A7K0ELU3_9BACT|nr:SPOR domain-containing protein [Larkinella terrae]MRS62692.1 SPOR domain-containing protein [Larkinella terrae]
MVHVSDYLKKLLFQYDCIVIPELGGFILHYVPATFVEESGLYLPPRKKIAFNEALKLDDGLLTNYMMLHDGLTRDEAFQAIRQFVEELKVEVRQERIFTIEGLGLFSENEEGKLQFDPEIRHNFQGESYGFQPVTARLVNTVAVAEEKKPVMLVKAPVQTPILVEAEEVPVEGKEVELPVSGNRRQYLAWAAAVLLICSLGIVFSVKKTPSQVLSSLNPFELFVSDKEEPTAAPVETVTEKPQVVTETPKAEPVAETVSAPVAQPVETPVVEPTKPAVTAEAVAPVVEPKKTETYYLAIAGSFASKANARRLMRRLRKGGFETAYVLPQARTKELIKVAAIGSPDKNEILASIEAVSKLSGARAWVHKIGQ